MRATVTSLREVRENVRRFAREIENSPTLQSRLGQVHAWYALPGEDGWLFAPSKFIGYPANSAEAYAATYQDSGDGRQTENALKVLLNPIDNSPRVDRQLREALVGFLASFGKVPRQGARITVVPSETDHDHHPGPTDPTLPGRIVSDPDIVGGRPRIKGTRVRVSDILDMLASGVSQDEILADYPYLAKEDILAALAYAASAADHRLVHAV